MTREALEKLKRVPSSVNIRLLPLPKGEGTAGWPLICPGEPQEDLGRGQQKCLRRDIRRRVPPLF